MTRFVSIGKYFINTEHVLTVTAPDANDRMKSDLGKTE